MSKVMVKMSYCRGDKSLAFRVDDEGGNGYQLVRGDGYFWDGDTLVIRYRGRIRFYFPNAILC